MQRRISRFTHAQIDLALAFAYKLNTCVAVEMASDREAYNARLDDPYATQRNYNEDQWDEDEALGDLYVDAAKRALKELDVKGQVFKGGFRTVVILKNIVLKIGHGTTWDDDLDKRLSPEEKLIADTKYIQQMRKTDKKKFFPLTQLVRARGGRLVQIQERIQKTGVDASDALESAVIALAMTLGVDDVCGYNFGWCGKGKNRYPVFFDCDLRMPPVTRPINYEKPKIKYKWLTPRSNSGRLT